MVNTNLVDILTPIRKGATDEDLKELFIEAVKRREPFHKAPPSLVTLKRFYV
jgi:cyclic pyranopterin phosphate synthase